MFLLNLAQIDFNHIFNKSFRLLLSITSVLCYSLLVIMHIFMLRPMFKICGREYFSLMSKWFFLEQINKPLAASYSEMAVVCYLTNVLDMTLLSFGLLLCALFLTECCLLQRKRRQLHSLIGLSAEVKNERDKQKPTSQFGSDIAEATPDLKIMRQRLHKKSTTTRFIGRLSVLLPSAILSGIHLMSSLISYMLFHMVLPTLTTDEITNNEKFIEAVKWHTVIYLFLSFFLCGFYWSMVGINTSMLQVINRQSSRQNRFRRMNASVFPAHNTVL